MKFCTNCGSQLNDMAAYCANCGASVVGNEGFNFGNINQAPVSAVDPETKSKATRALIFGIVAVAISYVIGIPIVGIIFAVLAMGAAKAVLATNPTGSTRNLANIGKILGIVGLALSIYITVIWFVIIAIYALYFILLIFDMMASGI